MTLFSSAQRFRRYSLVMLICWTISPNTNRFPVVVCAADHTGVGTAGHGQVFCSLDPCANGGICHETSVAVTGGFKAHQNETGSPLPASIEHYWDRCECPKGYTGAFCEIKLILCDKQGDTCSNGMTCATDFEDVTGSDFYHCGCDGTGDFIASYATRYCEHLVVQPCGGGHVCVNGGSCVTYPNGLKSCECTQGWKGSSCMEQDYTPIDYTQFRPPTAAEKAKKSSGIALTVMFLIGLSVTMVVLAIKKRSRRPFSSPNDQEPNLPIDDVEMS